MAEDRDYIEEAQAEAMVRYGRELSAGEFAESFAGHNFEVRVHHLKNLKATGELSLDEAARRLEYEGSLLRMHDILTKVGR